MLPRPSSLSTGMAPPWVVDDPLADGETQTVPESTGLVVKKASKICGRASCRMPPPVSSSERENIYDDRYEPPALVLADALCTS
jgi:hypothetical protein